MSTLSGNVRARRPASPPPGLSHPPPPPPASQSVPLTSQRFPHPREEHLDADARRAAASKGFGPGRTKHFPPGGLNLTSGEFKLMFAIVVIASAVRLYRLSHPNSIVFDEVHFGKFASKYIKTQYYVDVHPPLAKLLITLAGFLFGYDGGFDFKDIGKIYENVPYVAMRMLPAGLGVATIPLAYLTLRALDCRATTALLASLFVTFENGLVTQSRHILLDSPLVFFTALTVFLWVGFCNEDKHQPFTRSWWTWLALSGASLGAVLSCKWVGLFTVATVGCSTLYQLWTLLGDLRVSSKLFMRHFVARAVCLILVPILFYMAMFAIHFQVLQNSGDGDGFMSSEFQHTLGGRGMADTFADVAIGSTVSIRHVNTQGGYLHSHSHNFPTGSKQQQITLYPHRDHNNDWLLFNATQEGDPAVDWENHPLTYVTTGSRIKLRHLATEKHLHSHDHRPPVSDVDFQNEVSGYGMKGFIGDLNDDWIIEIAEGDRKDKESGKRVRTLRTKFRLRHVLQGCYLFSHKVKLPDWGYEQQEVTCNKNAVLANSLWFVETTTNSKLPPDAPKVNYRAPGFLSKFWELQQVMWATNAGLTDRHTYDSRPESWPRLIRGINFWVKDHRQVYLIGNPLIWYLSTLAVAAYIAVRGFLILRAKRGFRDFDNSKVIKYDTLCGFFFMGWGLHYFPFFLMQRQLFLHHYFPALYFAILLFSTVFDLLTSTLRPRVRLQIGAVFAILAIWNFYHLSPLSYGSPWTRAQCENAKWLKTWDFSCNDYHVEMAHYDLGIPASPQKSAAAVTTIGGEVGGRGAFVVEDKNAAANENEQNKEATTSAGQMGRPEPGVDVFAEKNKPLDQAKSSAVAAAAAAGKEEAKKDPKEVSSVNVLTTAVAGTSETVSDTEARSPTVESKVETETTSSVSTSVSTSASASSSSASETPATEKKEEPPLFKKPAGPLGEIELEAAKVAEELYPEAAAAAA